MIVKSKIVLNKKLVLKRQIIKLRMKNNYCLILLFLGLSFSCSKEMKDASARFSLLSSSDTNIDFKNIVKENANFNFLNYTYIYNGAGVAVADINNDGLEDLFFTSNQGLNKLYLNQGDLEFKDITQKAKIADQTGWTTGVTAIDINNDGWLDFYVCKSGSINSHSKRRNKLFINQKNNTFKEQAKAYGLDHFGFSTQAYFFDFDNDDDLDMYLVNHRKDFSIKEAKEPFNSDQLFRNDGATFKNITKKAGILNKGWGLSASIGDFNNDDLLDVYVANDFFDPDYLYINQGNGTFKDEALKYFNHISTNSMGSDFADINNDLKPDLIVLDMMAEDHIRSKENMATMSISNFHNLVKKGYHYQYMSNVLQLNNGDNTYSEIGQLAGISKTDWSWAPLIADFDNDGFKDVFVTNGIQNDLTNQDFRNQMKTNVRNRKRVSLDAAKKIITSEKLSNYIFKNNQDLTFKNTTKSWGLDAKINSNGAAYADLDNDGDLDLIINNQGEKASIYKNNTKNNYIIFKLKGPTTNPFGIGAEITVFSENLQQTKKQFLSRGFQSSVSAQLHFGLGNKTKVDSVFIDWGNNTTEKLKNVEVNQTVIFNIEGATNFVKKDAMNSRLFKRIIPTDIGINYKQKENIYDDFKLQLLLPQKQSEKSSALAVGDINNDGLDDFFVGNAKGEKGAIYCQSKDGKFIETNQKLFELDKDFEDTNAKFLDVDSDNDLDLYVTSGGYDVKENSPLLQDRLYLNNGKGKFTKTKLPKITSNSKAIAFSDFDKDGDIDIFIGNNAKHGQYPLSENSYFLENEKGKYSNNIEGKFDSISDLRMINDAIFSDFDLDGDEDLIVVGEWMSITFFENKNNQFYKKHIDGVTNISGWYQSITPTDIDADGDTDYIIGNWGNNNKFHPNKQKPLHIYAGYFDENTSFDIALSKVSKTGDLLPVRGKECSTEQTPFLNQKIKTFKEFAAANMFEIYGSEKLENAHHFIAQNFSSFILKNNRGGMFEIKKLPNEAQFSPTLGASIIDINNDGYLDVFGIGNVYESEVETIRYDASKGYVLLGDQKGGFTFCNDSSYFNNMEAKAIEKISINGVWHFIILNKNAELTILKVN
jgi:hypothetical protein